MDKKSLIKALAKVVGSEDVLSSPKDLLTYSYDAGGKQASPDVVVLPDSTAEVSAIMKIASREQVPIIARGAGTNLTGGTVPSRGGIVLELSRLNRILALDTARQRVVVEPGVVNLDLQNALKPLGYMYAPDPASQKSSTLGGNAGEDAGGPHCLRYGVTHNHVLGAEVVLADGRVVQVGAPTEDSYGYDLLSPLIGSEGTLGVITKLVLRIMHLPESYQTMLAVFETLEDAFQCASDIIASGIVPGALELLDAPVIGAIEASVHAGYPLDAEAILLIELDVLKEAQARQSQQITEICHKNKAREVRAARTAAERDVLWSGRRGAFGAVARVRPAYACQDVTVPRNKLVSMLREVNKIAQKYQLLIGNVAHAGDGNFHPLMMFDNRDPDESERVHKAGKEILAAGVALGGTISGEHGVGLEKQDSMPLMFRPSELKLMRLVKTVFDPERILNPGKKIPPEKAMVDEVREFESLLTTVPGKSTSLQGELAAIVGAENVLARPEELANYQIDGMLPSFTVFPAIADQIAQLVKVAQREGIPVTPWGNGSRQALGLPLTKTGIVLSLKRMNHIIELDQSNLTAEAEAGIAHAELQKELAKHGLYFPLEPEDSEIATIGGTLATSSSGPKRLLYGTARDLVLGVTAVTPTGEVVRAGIKTMKNVAGYDLCRLFLGSWGTLGVITRAILKLSYLPETHSTLLLRFSSVGDAFQTVSEVLNSFLRPESIELIDARAAQRLESKTSLKLEEDEVVLLVGVAGSQEEVGRHIAEIKVLAEANQAQAVGILAGIEEETVWSIQQEIHRYSVAGMVRGKAVVPVSKTGEMYQEIRKVAGRHQLQAGVTGRAGSGILYPALFAEGQGAQNGKKALAAVADLIQSAGRLGGFFLVERGSPEVRQAYDLISQRSDYELMKRLKRSLDRKNIFNPGKLVRTL